jgi:hypothetical protein
MGLGYYAAYDALDLSPYETLDQRGQIGIEPGLQQRAQFLAHDVLDGWTAAMHLDGAIR